MNTAANNWSGTMETELLTPKEAAGFLRLSESFLWGVLRPRAK
jgi:hypothetical protein